MAGKLDNASGGEWYSHRCDFRHDRCNGRSRSFVTGDTYIPYHLRKGAQRPSAAHPNGMTLFAYSWTGEKIWQWQLENMPQGLRIDEKDRYAVLSVSKRTQDPNESLHGVSVFDLTADGSGLSKYLYTYRTEGELPYDTLAMSADGAFIVVVEVPIAMPDETVRERIGCMCCIDLRYV